MLAINYTLLSLDTSDTSRYQTLQKTVQGMPNTLERLVDGSVAAHAMRQTAHTMHFSQAVMSCFKEPQKAVSCIQKILDGDTAAMALLADLSKAFERVNPH